MCLGVFCYYYLLLLIIIINDMLCRVNLFCFPLYSEKNIWKYSLKKGISFLKLFIGSFFLM